MSLRWDDDQRGEGIGTGTVFLPGLAELAELANLPGWVAEDPEAHLGRHLQETAARLGADVTRAAAESDGTYRVEVTCDAAAFGNRRALRELGWHLLGAVAESASCVLEAPLENGLELRMLTGMPPGSTDFATHGHALVLAIRAEAQGSAPA